MKKCQQDGCSSEAVAGERFCPTCRKTVIAKVRSGYAGLGIDRVTQRSAAPVMENGHRKALDWFRGQVRDE